MQYFQPSAAPHKVISSSGKQYAPLSRPSTAPAVRAWRPATTASSRASLDMASTVVSRHPSNPRYAHVEAKTDTGPNMRKIEERFGITSARYKRTENFRRMKPEKLAQELRAGTMHDVLLLDLREREDFDSFHLRDAHNYPASMMSRSMYQFTPEILEFKNKEGKLMVLYDLEEKLAVAVGSNWYEKGIDNFVVLSGGLLAVARTHPDLVEGALPMRLMEPPTHSHKAQRGGSRRPASAASARGGGGPAGGGCEQNANGNLNLRQGGVSCKVSTAGMASATSASRSVPRPVQWNQLRASEPMMVGLQGSFYTRSMESGVSLR